MKTDRRPSRAWVSYAVGAVVGAVVGAIAAVNVMIYSGVEDGYQAGLARLFEHNAVAGVAAVGLLVAGPVVGVVVARRMRRSG